MSGELAMSSEEPGRSERGAVGARAVDDMVWATPPGPVPNQARERQLGLWPDCAPPHIHVIVWHENSGVAQQG
jgi:hypothetical protein